MPMTRKDVEDLIAAAATRGPVSFGGEEIQIPVNLHGADLHGVDLSGLDLRGANCHGVNFSGCNLKGTKLAGANCHEADFTGADMKDCDAGEANFHGAKLNAVATNAKTRFDKANLHGADKRGLTGGATFKGANLTKIKE